MMNHESSNKNTFSYGEKIIQSSEECCWIDMGDSYGNVPKGKVVIFGIREKGIQHFGDNSYPFDDLVTHAPKNVAKNWERMCPNSHCILPKELHQNMKPCFLTTKGYHNLVKYLINKKLMDSHYHSKYHLKDDDDDYDRNTYYSIGYKLTDDCNVDYKHLCEWTEENGLVEHTC